MATIIALQQHQKIQIERPLYEHEVLRKEFNYKKTHRLVSECDTTSCIKTDFEKWKNMLKSMVPILNWLPKYKWKDEFIKDLIAGITVAIMHIPQGIGYAMLGNVPPVVGIYMAFFPVLIYFLLGTSRHNSMGTFAVVCLMTGRAVLEHSDPYYFRNSMSNGRINTNSTENNELYTPIQVATAVTFCVGLIQLGLCLLRLGCVSALLSEPLVSGFTTGAAVTVFTTQIKDILGLKLKSQRGFFEVINTYRALYEEIGNVNYIALSISCVTISMNVFSNEVLKPVFAKYSSFPIPIELISIIFGSAASYLWKLQETYNVVIIGNIPNGLPDAQIPPMALISSVMLESITIAIVSYSITMSMGLIFAQKLNYEIDPNQELLAQGAGNIFGSFFSCMPFSASLSRSSIQQSVGGRTQLTSLVSCFILLIILLFIGPLFEPLPRCVLASIIVVALKGMLMQILDCYKFFSMSKLDGAVWLISFSVTVIVAIDLGLFSGIIMSLISIMILEFKPYMCLLGNIPHTDLYLDMNKYGSAKEIPGIKIFHYNGGLNFAIKNTFKNEFQKLLNLNLLKQLEYKTNLEKIKKFDNHGKSDKIKSKYEKLISKINKDLRIVIIDFSSLSYIDSSGVFMLKILADMFHKLNIPLYITGISEPNYEIMAKCGLFLETDIKTFIRIHDAVLYSSEFHGLKITNGMEKIYNNCDL